MTDHEACLAALRSVEAASAIWGEFGICALAEDYIETVLHLDSSELMLLVSDAMKLWPKRSESAMFPVPGIDGCGASVEFYFAQKNSSMWEGAYGDLRKELLAYLIDYFEARVGMNK